MQDIELNKPGKAHRTAVSLAGQPWACQGHDGERIDVNQHVRKTLQQPNQANSPILSKEMGSRSRRRDTVESWPAIRFSTSATRVSVRFQRASNSPATRRFSDRRPHTGRMRAQSHSVDPRPEAGHACLDLRRARSAGGALQGARRRSSVALEGHAGVRDPGGLETHIVGPRYRRDV
jgi:hypothetical protein